MLPGDNQRERQQPSENKLIQADSYFQKIVLDSLLKNPEKTSCVDGLEWWMMPSPAASTVGVAMVTDTALETADIALMFGDLSNAIYNKIKS